MSSDCVISEMFLDAAVSPTILSFPRTFSKKHFHCVPTPRIFPTTPDALKTHLLVQELSKTLLATQPRNATRAKHTPVPSRKTEFTIFPKYSNNLVEER